MMQLKRATPMNTCEYLFVDHWQIPPRLRRSVDDRHPGANTMRIDSGSGMRWLAPGRGAWMAIIAVALAGCGMHDVRPPHHVEHYRVVGYDTAKSDIAPQDVGKIDTLIFAFARLVDGEVTLPPAEAVRLHRLIALKVAHPRLDVVVSVGGWTVDGFSDAASTAANRQRFADSAARLLAANGADGLDVDWEYPGHAEAHIKASAQDRDNFTLLLKDLRATLDRAGDAHGHRDARHYTLSIAAADGAFVSGIDIAAVEPSLDWFNLMTYDFVNSMTPTTGHHTGLYTSTYAPGDARSTDKAVRQFLATGVPSRKLVIGVAFYGREFADVQPAHDGLYQAYGHYLGGHSWPQLKADFINRDGYVRYWDEAARAPYLWNAATHRFISYDAPQSIAAKAAYVKSRQLGGIMYWEQGQDPQGELLDAVWRGLQP
jgi:chitinase